MMPSRDEEFLRLSQETFDVLVVGGGITGAGAARDAALRGLRVALVEQDDFASGTSSRSSRLIHGGLRYLEHAQFRMVFESSRERRTLLRIAPRLVRPLRFTWPVYEGDRVPRWKIGAGLTLYDALSLFRNVERHHRLSARDVVGFEPHMESRGLRGGASYFDAATDDARLTLATVLSARHHGGVVVNHARVEAIHVENGRACGAIVRNRENDREVRVAARVVVNAAGPWSERVESLAHPALRPAIRASKGVHVCVSRERIGNTAALAVTAPQDGRVMFILPAGDFAIIGTTDTFDDVAPEDVRATARDVGYLLSACNHYFPEARLTRDDVISAWAGLRPLAATHSNDAGPGDVSREHSIVETMPGLVRATGGKLTTYRAMAEEIVDVAQRSLGARVTKSRTAFEVLPQRGEFPAMGRIVPERPYTIGDMRYAVDHEMARTLGDLLIRRVPMAFETRDHGKRAARAILPRVSEWLGWDESRARSALDDYDAEAERIFTIDD